MWQETKPPAWGLAVCLVLLGAPAAAQSWIEFADVSVTAIVADEEDPDPVGLTDTFEKDLAVGDVDRDGDPDVVVARKVRFSEPGGKRNALFLNQGGVLIERSAEDAPQFLDQTDDRDVILADVDGDGWLDLVTATTFAEQPRLYMNLRESLGVWRGFAWVPTDGRLPEFSPAPQFCAVVAGDVDNDDDLDLFFVDYDNNLEDRLLINDGAGFFSDETLERMSAAMSRSAFGTDAAIVDMNGDGARDIVKLSTLNDNPNSVRILYNAGGAEIGTFDAMEHVYTESPYMMEVVDLNRDQRPDIYVVDDQQDAYLINTGNNAQGRAEFTTLTVVSSPTTANFGGNTATADFDDNGYPDLLVADVDTDIPGCDRHMAALRNLGDAPLVTVDDPLAGAGRPWLPNGTFDIAVADFDGDGALDFWAGTCAGNRLFLGTLLFRDGFESGDTSAWSAIVE